MKMGYNVENGKNFEKMYSVFKNYHLKKLTAKLYVIKFKKR